MRLMKHIFLHTIGVQEYSKTICKVNEIMIHNKFTVVFICVKMKI